MLTFLLILLVVAAAFIMLIILAQNPKGGGLSSTFGGTSQIIGARQTADFLEKATWYVAIGILVVVIFTNFFLPSGQEEKTAESMMSPQIEEMATPMPQTPAEQDQSEVVEE